MFREVMAILCEGRVQHLKHRFAILGRFHPFIGNKDPKGE